ncbi:MAG: glutathione S-transferase [Gammaproteobacteria bacterium]
MLTVHHLNNSRSQRILWLLEELGLPYEVQHYERDPVTMRAPAALRAIHPLGKSPVLTDGGVTVAETGAIIEYLLEVHGAGRLRPAAGTPTAREFTYWLHFAEGSAMTPLLFKLVFARILESPMPFFARPIARGIVGKVMSTFIEPGLKLHLDFMEQSLAGREWFCGDQLTGADIMLSFPLEAMAARQGLGGYPALQAFVDRVQCRPAYRRALERGGSYAFGPDFR